MRFHEVTVFRFLLVFFFIVLCNTMIICPDAAFADNEDNLNDILDGFEEDTAIPDNDMDVLNGFDDEFVDSFAPPLPRHPQLLQHRRKHIPDYHIPA